MIGTPFVTKDEIHNKRIEHLDKKPWEQEARDDKGRKHFYGAFTGALRESSVGYKGTVGSKEGFQPQTFNKLNFLQRKFLDNSALLQLE